MISINDLISPANRLIAGLLRSPAHRLASKGLMELRWNGRSSGTAFRAPVGYQRSGDQVTVLISKPDQKSWWKNFRSEWPAELLIMGREYDAIGLLVETDDPVFTEHIELALRRLPWMASQFGGFKFDKSTGLTSEQRSIVREHVAVVVFTLVDCDSATT
ncbi:MAG: hypothetical protein IH940_03910 [Acidobacteria bacterium]|nr:hypothetical protein [Acidobacteriota bacterium]